MFTLIGNLIKVNLGETDLGTVIVCSCLRLPFTGCPIQFFQNKGKSLFGRRSLDYVTAPHKLGSFEACMRAGVSPLRAEEVPLTAYLVECTGSSNPARTGAAFFNHKRTGLRSQENSGGAAVRFQNRCFIGVEDNVVQNIVFHVFVVGSITAVTACVCVDFFYTFVCIRRTVVNPYNLFGDHHIVPGNIEDNGLPRPLLDDPTSLGEIKACPVHINGDIVREHGGIHFIRLLRYKVRFLLVRCRGVLEVVNQTGNLTFDFFVRSVEYRNIIAV